MDSEKWSTIKRILDEAAVWPAAERRALVERECGDDAALLSEVESFLDFDEEIHDFIEDPLWSIHTKAAAGPEPSARGTDSGRRFGAYRILRLLERGGMGVVFLAAREDDYQQRVALKLVSWGMDSEEVLRRFYTERQILANLQHPGISSLLDGGTTEDGTPYFVMEYVEGEPIDRYCERRQLPLRRRLELFRKVCAVVHYAHQNLVVHRDLKPNNILITEGGEPKLLDFGIAKLLQPHRLAEAIATMPGQGPMTPEYASPEQIKNQPITTACDVYALGVLLYRLLAGRPPYQLQGRSYDEMVDLVCHTEPRRPSTATAQGATRPGRRGGESAPRPASVPESDRRIRRQLAGDLDAIVMKAIRKEPRHRYASALELASDLQRHLSGLPVEARHGTWTYVGGKFIRRHKLGLAAVLLFFGLAVAMAVLWRQAVQGQAEAERERALAETVIDWVAELFNAANPDESGGEDVTVRELLDLGRVTIAGELVGEPEIQARIYGVLGTVYENLGLHEKAKEVREQALRRSLGIHQDDHPDLAKAINDMASSYYYLRDDEKAEVYFRRALEMLQRLRRDEKKIASIMFNLASILARRDKPAEAEELHLEALAIFKRIYGPDHFFVARSTYGLATVYLNRGDARKAESSLRQALEKYLMEYGHQHTQVASVLSTLGKAFQAQGEYEEAKNSYEEALEIRVKRYGAGHANAAKTKTRLASVLLALGETETAGVMIRQALDTLRKTLPEGDPAIADAEDVLEDWLRATERNDDPEWDRDGSVRDDTAN